MKSIRFILQYLGVDVAEALRVDHNEALCATIFSEKLPELNVGTQRFWCPAPSSARSLKRVVLSLDADVP